MNSSGRVERARIVGRGQCSTNVPAGKETNVSSTNVSIDRGLPAREGNTRCLFHGRFASQCLWKKLRRQGVTPRAAEMQPTTADGPECVSTIRLAFRSHILCRPEMRWTTLS